MDHAGSGRWVRAALVAGAVYLLLSLVFGMLAANAGTETMVVLWRRAAWLTSAVVFVLHVRRERSVLAFGPVPSALHAAVGAALGACGLAIAALFHGLTSGTGDLRLLVIALVAFPALTVLPAFLVGLLVAAMPSRNRPGIAS